MPGRDGSGPLGLGAGSGWGRGPCGRGPGLRKGFGWNEPVELSKEEQKKVLEAHKKEIEKRLNELK